MIKCDKCGYIMYKEPVVLTTDPPQYRYHCPKCDNTKTSFQSDNEYVIMNYQHWQRLMEEAKKDMNTESIINAVENEKAKMKKEENDMVNHPAHYTAGGVECIEGLKAATIGLEGIEAVCTANAIKYLWRWKHKNGVQDLEKAKWYIDYLIRYIGQK